MKTLEYYMDHCFTCGKEIHEEEDCGFTCEFDAFICQDCIEKILSTPIEELNEELKIIKREFTS